MNYNYLRYFSVLADVQHYTTAAAQLEISQPALSSAIRHLEDELGVKLFEKTGRNIRLTEQGQYYQKKVAESLNILHAANETLATSHEKAPVVIRIGFVSGVLRGAVAKQMAKYLQQEVRCSFLLTEGSAQDLLDLLRQEKLDMAIVDTPSRDRNLQFEALGEREFCVAMAKAHPLANSSGLTASQISSYPQIGFDHNRDSFQQWASHPQDKSHYTCQVNTVSGALDLVSVNLGLAVIPNQCRVDRPDVTYVPLKGKRQALYATTLYDRWLDPPIWTFMEQVIATVRNAMQ